MKTGIVVKSTGSWYTVKGETEKIQCRLRGNFRTRNLKITNPVAVGDHVGFEITGDHTGIINDIKERKNYIIRKSTNLSRESQIMAANIDQAILMITLEYPQTPLEFVDRFLISAETFHIKTILVINKTDLYKDHHLVWMEEVIRLYEYAGYMIIPVSIINNINIPLLVNQMKNKLSLLAGNSGVGKTTLLNHLCPGLNLKTAEISDYHQTGKHTTTYPEMIELAEKTYVIDSPGIRGFGVTELNKNEIGLYFPDIFKLSANCQFYNCSHIHEPKCAVIEAYQAGILHESRYRSYFNIFHDTSKKYRTS